MLCYKSLSIYIGGDQSSAKICTIKLCYIYKNNIAQMEGKHEDFIIKIVLVLSNKQVPMNMENIGLLGTTLSLQSRSVKEILIRNKY